MKRTFYTLFLSLILLSPVIRVFADSPDATSSPLVTGGLIGLFGIVRGIINLIVPLLFALAVVFFLFGIFKYFFLHADQPEKREEGRKFILWGIIALFVMVSFWGLVNILSNTFFGVRVPDPGDTSWRQDSEQTALLASVREGRSVVRV